MSRVGRKPIVIPSGVKVLVNKNEVTVEGPKGKLVKVFHPDMQIEVVDGQLLVKRPSDNRLHRSLHGLTRTLINNMLLGVTKGFSKALEVSGVGYRASVDGRKLILQLGYSQPVVYEVPPGINVEVEKQNLITVRGVDKWLVGEVAAKIRSFRKPDPYKGKGIRYVGERIRFKVGKTGTGVTGGK